MCERIRNHSNLWNVWQHIEWNNVLGKPFVGEERQRVQELCVGLDRSLLEVVSVGLMTCGEVELVRQVHTFFWRSAQQIVVFELQVREEVEGVRQEVREVNGEKKGRRETLTS